MSLAKGGDKLSPPFLYGQQEENKNLTVPTQRVYSVLFNLPHPLKPNHLNGGWRGSGMSGYKRLRIRNLPQREQGFCIKQKGIAMTGLKSGCAVSRYARS